MSGGLCLGGFVLIPILGTIDPRSTRLFANKNFPFLCVIRTSIDKVDLQMIINNKGDQNLYSVFSQITYS